MGTQLPSLWTPLIPVSESPFCTWLWSPHDLRWRACHNPTLLTAVICPWPLWETIAFFLIGIFHLFFKVSPTGNLKPSFDRCKGRFPIRTLKPDIAHIIRGYLSHIRFGIGCHYFPWISITLLNTNLHTWVQTCFHLWLYIKDITLSFSLIQCLR